MKKILHILYSSLTTVVLLLIMASALGVATFIEDRYDTETARYFVYNARWFEALFVLLTINLIGHIGAYKLISKRKWSGLLFHVSFIVIIIGAAVTRYFGFEGSMHIREGQSSNVIYSSEPYLTIGLADKADTVYNSKPFSTGIYSEKDLKINFKSSSGDVNVTFKEYIPNAVQSVVDNVPGGVTMLEIMVAGAGGRQNLVLNEGETKQSGALRISLNNAADSADVQISASGTNLLLISKDTVLISDMSMNVSDSLMPGEEGNFVPQKIYSVNGTMIVFSGLHPDARTEWVAGTADDEGAGLLKLNVNVAGKDYEALVFGGSGYYMNLQPYNYGGQNLLIGYGEKPVVLPFSLFLNDFILDRYAGSMSPSSYASEITLLDPRKNLKENYRIFMNNVLDYGKYRFFQSSYDQDEKGTILSVNRDYYGTRITYLGYLLMIAGFVFTLFNKYSRFQMLARKIGHISFKRRAGTLSVFILLATLLPVAAFAQSGVVSASHAEEFGTVISQTFDGRFEPVHSLAYDVMHKIARKDEFDIAGKGKLNAMQVMLDMILHPEFWQEQKIIYIREKSVRDAIGIDSKYASLRDFFTADNKYKLQSFAEEAFRKKQSQQNSFDKEIIKVDERLNVFVMTSNGSMLKIFPDQASTNNKWVSFDDQAATRPHTGAITIINEELKLPQLTYRNIMIAYFTELSNAMTTGDYSKADRILGFIKGIQRQSDNAGLLASETKIKTEVLYNKLQIFIFLRNLYAMLSVILLALAFADNLWPGRNKLITWALNAGIALLAAGFLYHTFGLILRWYLTGHAPWSNGYESLLLVAWGGLLAGFSFLRYSKITLAATALLAFFMLMTASHSSYDPQLTNLQPVLKSYWLIIHVATLTISYGFLGLGFFLGMINLGIFVIKGKRKKTGLDSILAELTSINEMNLTVGLVLATIGTFLGGVWANESWGRYWGWDAKETWALVIVLAYTLVLHMRFIPRLATSYAFNVGSVLGFGSVIMTFVGVNYYLSKGLHSYGAGDTPVFPLWAWVIILSILAFIVVAGIRQHGQTKPDELNQL